MATLNKLAQITHVTRGGSPSFLRETVLTPKSIGYPRFLAVLQGRPIEERMDAFGYIARVMGLWV